jgi:2-polyprenyl-3-methyl-5-hydroxy-6-metoxy-1,4-benzoquinol methylase
LANEWDEYAENWDIDDSVHEYAKKAFDELSTIISIDGLSIFDFGCGTGALTQLLSPAAKDIVALNGSSEMKKPFELNSLKGTMTVLMAVGKSA